MSDSSSNWQDYLDRKLVNRLTRPLYRPGMMNMAMGRNIISRCDRFLNRLPLLSQQMQRWGNINFRSSDSVPIVYARSFQGNGERGTGNSVGFKQRFGRSNVDRDRSSVPIIQRKLNSSQSLNTQPINNISSENKSIPPSPPYSRKESSFPLSSYLREESSLEVPLVKGDLGGSKVNTNNPDISNRDRINTSDRTQENSLLSIQNSQRMNSLSDSLSPLKWTPISSEESRLEVPLNKGDLGGAKSNTNNPDISDRDRIDTSDRTQENSLLSIQNSQRINSLSDSLSPLKWTPSSSEEFSLEVPLFKGDLGGSKSNTTNLDSSERDRINTSARTQNDFIPNNQRINSSSNSFKNINSINKNNLPVAIAKSVNPQINLEEEKLFAKKIADRGDSFLNVSIPQTKKANSNSDLNSIPLIIINSQINSISQSPSLPSLPLVSNYSFSKNIDRPTNSSQQNPRISNTDSFSSPQVFSNSLLTKETATAIEANKANSKIDIDTIADRVERKLMRRLVIEGERRGKIR
jgi:hypothetical protein